ncbi:hypothetical protein Tco_0409183 [Tanacetum coccineum]
MPTLNLFCVLYVPSYNSGWMSFSKQPGKNTPQCYTKPLDSLKNWNNRFFWVDERVFPTVMEWCSSALKDKMPLADSYSAVDVAILNTHRTPIQKQPEELLCLVGLSRNYFLGDDEYPTFLYDDDREMDLFDLISAPNLTKVPAAVAQEVAPEPDLEKEVTAMGPLVNKKCRKRGNDGADANAPPKVLRKDHAAVRPSQSTLGGKSLTAMGLQTGSTFSAPATHKTPDAKNMSDPDPLSYAKPKQYPERDVAQSSKKAAVTEDPDSERSASFTSMGGSPGSVYQPGWGVTNNCRLDISEECQDMVDHIKAVAQIARRDQRIQAREEHIKHLETLLEAEADMKKAAEAKNAELVKELESLRVQFSDL